MKLIAAALATREGHGMTVLLVTNDDDVAARADRTLRLKDGLIDGG